MGLSGKQGGCRYAKAPAAVRRPGVPSGTVEKGPFKCLTSQKARLLISKMEIMFTSPRLREGHSNFGHVTSAIVVFLLAFLLRGAVPRGADS